MSTTVHINVQAAYQEATTLRCAFDEIRSLQYALRQHAMELSATWEGASARRVEQALSERSELIGKLSNNVELISVGLRRTAQLYEEAQQGESGHFLSGYFDPRVLQLVGTKPA